MYIDNKDLLDEKLAEGAAKARKVASETLARVREKTGYLPSVTRMY